MAHIVKTFSLTVQRMWRLGRARNRRLSTRAKTGVSICASIAAFSGATERGLSYETNIHIKRGFAESGYQIYDIVLDGEESPNLSIQVKGRAQIIPEMRVSVLTERNADSCILKLPKQACRLSVPFSGSARFEIDIEHGADTKLEVGIVCSDQQRFFRLPYMPTRITSCASEYYSAYFDPAVGYAGLYSNEMTSAHYLSSGNKSNPVHESIEYKFARNLVEALPILGAQKSRFRDVLVGIPVFDLWSGTFQDAEDYATAIYEKYKIRGALIFHNWQSFGYDNKLPSHYPPTERVGGELGARRLARRLSSIGWFFALHENYRDMYTDSPDFQENALSTLNGAQIKAWFNSSTKQQSYMIKPSHYVTFANAEAQKSIFIGANASFIDVSTAAPPWHNVEHLDDSLKVGGAILNYKNTLGLLGLASGFHAGPVFGEGLNHAFYAGAVDGVEAQFGVGYKGPGQDAPLLPQFDLLRVRPYSTNHGMGYLDRWQVSSEGSARSCDLKVYVLQEAVFNHSAFIPEKLKRDDDFVEGQIRLISELNDSLRDENPIGFSYYSTSKREWVAAENAGEDGFGILRLTYDHFRLYANSTSRIIDLGSVQLRKGDWLLLGDGILIGTYSFGQENYSLNLRPGRSAYKKIRSDPCPRDNEILYPDIESDQEKIVSLVGKE
jgi:hypothetical protein